ncbi:putative E3 ubiquitin/ISG15 ligase TRIM25-like [Scophthalmus maximus]|uniref:Putative E3 ubiquitin/ISG15 ligase TRIM25-like n=1 Tax=Scophthalmus maximus TaxID=52904 RepID=A0A2U9AVL0_SCOMX|nr:putative E3 ubiquitin/ISG15 ligase TRIM25-like [Scophthalmus maximus]
MEPLTEDGYYHLHPFSPLDLPGGPGPAQLTSPCSRLRHVSFLLSFPSVSLDDVVTMSAKLWTEEQFNCPVCLDLPNDPVTIPCGHSYCMACIKDYWSKDDPKGNYSCPQCRQTFCPKPTLSRNTMLAEAVEQLRKGARPSDVRDSMRSARRVSSSSSSSSKSKGKLSSTAVPCDMCKGEPRAAVKSCLTCMSSYCESHLKPHQTQKGLKKHELIAPTGNLAEKICTQHKYLQEFFCRQCQMFICWLCTSNLHKGHECVSTKAERLEKQKALSDMQAENQQRLKDREQELKDMRKMMEGMKRSSDRLHDDAEQALAELLRSVERLQELLDELLDQAGLEKMGQAQGVIDSLDTEIKELRRRDTQMKELARCEDHIHYLKTYESMCSPLESGDLPTVVANQDASFEPVRDAILDLRERVEDLCNQELGKITKQVREISIDSIQAPEPRTREEFLQYSVTLTLDPNTAHRRLALSEGNTKAVLQVAAQPYPDAPQRFDGWTQVMCQRPLYEQRCYWEVEWRGRGSSVGVAYGSLNRKGSDARSGLGYNAQSWTLELSDTCCSAMHDNEKKDIPVTYSPRLAVYLDLSMGMLAFYSVAESMTHLHTFRTNFTQPLYATFGVGSGVGVGLDFALGQFTSSSDSVKICPM